MKKFIPLLISGVLVVGAFGCQDTHNNASKAPQATSVASPLPAKPASQTTQIPGKTEKTTATKNTTITTKSDDKLKTEVTQKLQESLPNNKLTVESKSGEIVIKGTAASSAELQKAEKLVKEVKGVKGVKVEAKVQLPNKI